MGINFTKKKQSISCQLLTIDKWMDTFGCRSSFWQKINEFWIRCVRDELKLDFWNRKYVGCIVDQWCNLRYIFARITKNSTSTTVPQLSCPGNPINNFLNSIVLVFIGSIYSSNRIIYISIENIVCSVLEHE